MYLEASAAATQSMMTTESMHKAWIRAKALGADIPAIKPNPLLTDSADTA